jgi:hypothetical protein
MVGYVAESANDGPADAGVVVEPAPFAPAVPKVTVILSPSGLLALTVYAMAVPGTTGVLGLIVKELQTGGSGPTLIVLVHVEMSSDAEDCTVNVTISGPVIVDG